VVVTAGNRKVIFNAHRLLYHATLGLRVMKKNKKKAGHYPHITLNPKPETFNTKISTLNPEPETLNPKPLGPKTSTRNYKPEPLNPKPQTRNPKPDTRNPKPQT